MTGLQAAILLLLGVCCYAGDFPDCENCVYHNNIGFMNSSVCYQFFMCIKNPSVEGSEQTYRFESFCCGEGQAWDQEHLTCVRDSYCDRSGAIFQCSRVRDYTEKPCDYLPGPVDRPETFFSPGYYLQECPYGTVWSQSDCTCVLGVGAFNRPPCTKLLNFEFNATYDSDSCYNFAKGEPYGEPSLDGEVLCLNGVDQFLQVGYLNNWFAWNPQARTFTLCLSIAPAVDGQTAGILSLNCEMVDPQSGASGSVLDIVLEGGVVKLFLGGEFVDTLMAPPVGVFTQLCITFNRGVYRAYWNGANHFAGDAAVSMDAFPQNTHSAATLGFKDGYGAFNGCIDDFMFYNEARDADFMGN